MKKHAFTMLELVFVIIVMGILAKFGVELLKQIYENYARTVIVTSIETKTQNAIMEISNRLRDRIPPSTRITAGKNGIQWVALDHNGWNNDRWSGIADIGPMTGSSSTLIETPGTKGTDFNGSAVYFIQNDYVPGSGSFSDNNMSINPMHPISGHTTVSGVPAFQFTTPLHKASEHYMLSDYAYSIDYNTGTQQLTLTKSRPWAGTTSAPVLIADHISDFAIKNFKGNAGGFIVVLCMSDKNYMNEGEHQICKQKFVF